MPIHPTFLLLLLLLALAVSPARAEAVTATPVPLAPWAPETQRVGAFEFRGAVRLEGGGLGGLSGLLVTDDGRGFVATGDRGDLLTGRLAHDDAGRLVGVRGVAVRRLPGVGHDRQERDAEEMARLPAGDVLVAFERDHRILRFPPDLAGLPARLPTPPGLEDAPDNGGLEALAAFPDGRLLAIEEGPDDGRRERRAWIAPTPIRSPEDWRPLVYRAAPMFRPTGAAVLPSGDLLVLERRASLLGGWGTRIVRVAGGAVAAGATLEGEELARLEAPLLADNFEAIAVRPGRDGQTLVYLLSDDNFSVWQGTYLVLLTLPPPEKTASR